MSYKVIYQGMFYDTNFGGFVRGSIVIKNEKIAFIDRQERDLTNVTDPINPAKVLDRYKEIIEDDDEVEVIDGRNCYITPGFIDTCSSIGLKEVGVLWEGDDSNEPTFSEGYELSVLDGIYPFDTAFKNAQASGVTAAHVMSSPEQVIGAKTAVIHTDGVTVDEMVVKQNLGHVFSMGDIPKEAFFDRNKKPLTRMGIAQKIKEALQVLLDNGLDTDEHPIFIRCYRKDDIDTALRIGRAFNINIILVHAAAYNPEVHQKTYKTNRFIVGPCFQGILRDELRDLSPEIYKKLLGHGLNFSFGTDHPTSDVQFLRLEAILALKNGVSEQAILRSLTTGAAELLGVNEQIGELKEELLADIVIWDEHPLTFTAKPKTTFIKGKKVFQAK